MYLHKTKNGHYTPPCCYFSGELEVVECLGLILRKNVLYTLSAAVPDGGLAFDGACAAGRDDILVLKLDDFHLSLCILFHVYTPPFAENFYVKQLLRRITQRVNSPGEVLPHRSALFSAMRCRFFA